MCTDYVSVIVYILSFSLVICTYNKESIILESLSNEIQTYNENELRDSSITDADTADDYYNCDFEDGICSFLRNDPQNTVNWTPSNGKNITRETGPFADHTLMNGIGSFAYVDVNKARANAVKLESIVFQGEYCVRFFYHMAGSETGELRVSMWRVESKDNIDKFVKTSPQGDRWKEVIFDVNPSSTFNDVSTVEALQIEYRIIFTAKGKGFTSRLGHIAIDDMEIYAGKCKISIGDASGLCTFDEDDCNYKSLQHRPPKWDRMFPRTILDGQIFSIVDHTLGTSRGGYWYFMISNPSSSINSQLVSPDYTKPETSLNCLQFHFYWDSESSWWRDPTKDAYIQVFLNNLKSQKPSWILTIGKNTTIQREWNFVETPIEITEEFKIVFHAVIDSMRDAFVAIDDVKLARGNCQEADINSTGYTTLDFTKSTDEAFNFTLDFTKTYYTTDNYNDTISNNETTYQPLNNTIDFFETTYWPDNFTMKENETTYWPDKFTLNETTNNPYGFTLELKNATIDQINFTLEYFNETQYPSNVTSEYRQTTYEPILNETNCDCGIKSISCKIDKYGNKHCLCISGSFQLEDICADCDCGRNSDGCYFERNGVKRCICHKNFSEKNGACARSCKTNEDCLHGEKCEINYYDSGFCICRDGYKGDRCELIDKCVEMQPVCSLRNATCRVVKDHAVCECPPHKVYNSQSGVCENICDPKACFNGICEIIGRKYRCRCDEGYAGERCDVSETNFKENELYTKTFYILAAVVIAIFASIVGLICLSVICRLRRRYKS